MEHNIQHTGNGLEHAIILAILWIMNLVNKIDPSIILTVLTAVGTLLYVANQSFTLYNNVKKTKRNDTKA